jgi:hypothetical protein
MQQVPQISQDLWDALDLKAQRLNVLVEIYSVSTLPESEGFNPDDATLRIADTTTAFLGNPYTRYVESVGIVNRTITKKFNTVSIRLNNMDRAMAAFVLDAPIEGKFCVIRLVSREFTATTLADSFVVFTGKCEKPVDANNESITIGAKQYIGSVDEEIPWRTFSPDDELGRESTDVLFEGFLFSAKPGTITYKERVRRGGFLGLLGFKKTVTRTLQYSNHQGVEVDKAVPLILGRAQVQLVPVAYIDAGGQINAIMAVGEGPIKAFFDQRVITSGFQFASVADSNPEVDQYRFGYPGNTNGQVPFLNNLAGGIPGNGYYSQTAMFSSAFYGTDVSQDDPAPEVIMVIMGMIVPVPDESQDFTLTDWTDNPAFLTRWLLTHSRTFNLNPAFINDPQCIKTACYCDDPVLDETNGERILLQESETANYGVLYRRYHSTALFTPEYFKHYFLGDGQDPLPELTLPPAEFYDPADGPPVLDPAIQTLVRRRFSSNVYLTERTKSVDFLFDVLLTTYRGFITQNARGKLDIKCRRPADNTIIRSTVDALDTEVAVNTVLPWVASLSGQVLIGTDTLTSEVRTVTGTRYSAVANSITLVVAGSLTRSGATLTGGDDDNPATGSVTVTGLGTLTVTIDGHAVSYTTVAADTTATAAAMLTQFLKADLTFQTYLKFTWDKDDPTVISIQSKLGFLELDRALVNGHAIGQEVLRIQLAFSDTGADHADLAAANILLRSFSWPVGSRQSSVNRIDGKFIDSPHDFQVQQVRTRDQTHIDQVGKVLPEEITLTGVDSFSQAKRLENSALAELRDQDFFTQHTADRRAMLLEEGDIIVNTHASGGFRNLALRVEEVSLDLQRMTVAITARRYLTSAYSDVAAARNVPLPTNLTGDVAFSTTGPPSIAFNSADFPPNGLIQTTASDGITSIRGGVIFGSTRFPQRAKVFLKRPLESTFTQIATLEPDANLKAIIPDVIASDEGTYTFQLEVCFVGGACNATKPEATITISYGALGAMLTESAGILLTEAGDFISMES